ncbi:MAG: type II/IV secretion system protein, partial [Proteobacteria bacterium]|nr:type II/IV secretion system protein [Pseudomonadota bacterium]
MQHAPTTRRRLANAKLQLDELVQMLAADGHLTQADADKLLTNRPARDQDMHPLIWVGDHKLTDARDGKRVLGTEVLTEWLAAKTHQPYLHIDPLKIDVARVCGVVTHAYAQRYHILPVEVSSQEVTVATAEPFDREWQTEMERMLGLRIRTVLANPADVRRYLGEFYSLARSVRHAMERQQDLPQGITNFEQLVQLGKSSNIDANDQAVVHIVDWLLQYAFEQRASDIHIEPRREECLVRFRIDGQMHLVYQAPMALMAAITNRIKLLGRLDVVEKRRPQDGRIKTRSPGGDEIELRLSTMPTAFGEKLVMRIFNPELLLKNFAELGFSDDENRRWRELIQQPNGIILVTGPTGSGKTTTLYSTLRELATPEVNVCTVEDPIENVYPHLNQMQVQHNIGLDFATGVRTLLRQDPDIIMIGEIRDLETAEMAVQAALTGHLVLSTLHTNDAPSAVTRLLDLGVPDYLIRATLLGVLAQRLARTLCPHCRTLVDADELAWNELVSPWKSNMPRQVGKPVGCLECRMTGYLGRTGIYEMLTVSPTLRRQIGLDKDGAQLREQAIKEGMRPLRLGGALKVAAGVTTIDEILR